jgi:hypothetical protein
MRTVSFRRIVGCACFSFLSDSSLELTSHRLNRSSSSTLAPASCSTPHNLLPSSTSVRRHRSPFSSSLADLVCPHRTLLRHLLLRRPRSLRRPVLLNAPRRSVVPRCPPLLRLDRRAPLPFPYGRRSRTAVTAQGYPERRREGLDGAVSDGGRIEEDHARGDEEASLVGRKSAPLAHSKQHQNTVVAVSYRSVPFANTGSVLSFPFSFAFAVLRSPRKRAEKC